MDSGWEGGYSASDSPLLGVKREESAWAKDAAECSVGSGLVLLSLMRMYSMGACCAESSREGEGEGELGPSDVCPECKYTQQQTSGLYGVRSTGWIWSRS